MSSSRPNHPRAVSVIRANGLILPGYLRSAGTSSRKTIPTFHVATASMIRLAMESRRETLRSLDDPERDRYVSDRMSGQANALGPVVCSVVHSGPICSDGDLLGSHRSDP